VKVSYDLDTGVQGVNEFVHILSLSPVQFLNKPRISRIQLCIRIIKQLVTVAV
jgi:hypothetical protein